MPVVVADVVGRGCDCDDDKTEVPAKPGMPDMPGMPDSDHKGLVIKARKGLMAVPPCTPVAVPVVDDGETRGWPVSPLRPLSPLRFILKPLRPGIDIEPTGKPASAARTCAC